MPAPPLARIKSDRRREPSQRIGLTTRRERCTGQDPGQLVLGNRVERVQLERTTHRPLSQLTLIHDHPGQLKWQTARAPRTRPIRGTAAREAQFVPRLTPYAEVNVEYDFILDLA
jgi:hypothetical protein